MSRDKVRQGTLSSINVTPLTDVLLVLLITFLLTATSFESRRSTLPLPQVVEVQQLSQTLTLVELTGSGALILPDDSRGVTLEKTQSQVQRLSTLRKNSPHQTLGLAIDRKVPYDELYRVMADAQSAGWEHVVVLTEPVQ